jgi:hypothetical protein
MFRDPPGEEPADTVSTCPGMTLPLSSSITPFVLVPDASVNTVVPVVGELVIVIVPACAVPLLITPRIPFAAHVAVPSTAVEPFRVSTSVWGAPATESPYRVIVCPTSPALLDETRATSPDACAAVTSPARPVLPRVQVPITPAVGEDEIVAVVIAFAACVKPAVHTVSPPMLSKVSVIPSNSTVYSLPFTVPADTSNEIRVVCCP